MTKLLFVVTGLLVGLVAGSRAQDVGMPARFDSLQRNAFTAPAFQLSDSRSFPFRSAYAWSEAPNDFLPDWRPEGWENIGYLNQASTARELRKDREAGSSYLYNDSSKEVVELRKNLLENIHKVSKLSKVDFTYLDNLLALEG